MPDSKNDHGENIAENACGKNDLHFNQIDGTCLQKMHDCDDFTTRSPHLPIWWPPPGFGKPALMMKANGDTHVQQLKRGDACRIALLPRRALPTPRQFVGRKGTVQLILEKKTKTGRMEYVVVMSLDACDNAEENDETKEIIREHYCRGNPQQTRVMMDRMLVVVRPNDIWPMKKANEYPEAFDYELAKAQQEREAAKQTEANREKNEKERRRRAMVREQKKQRMRLADDAGGFFSVDDIPFYTRECDAACADVEKQQQDAFRVSDSMDGCGALADTACGALADTAEVLEFFEK